MYVCTIYIYPTLLYIRPLRARVMRFCLKNIIIRFVYYIQYTYTIYIILCILHERSHHRIEDYLLCIVF